MDGYKHYIRTNASNIIIDRFSDWEEKYQDGDILVEESEERHYNFPITNERGQYLYTWDGTNQVLRSQTDLDAEWSASPPAPKTELELLREENDALKLRATQNSTDLQGFMDYFFVKFPE